MIFYPTKQTAERLKLAMADAFAGDAAVAACLALARNHDRPLAQWGLKLFYFDGRKCLQCVNFASKLTIFLFDLKVADMPHLPQMLEHYILSLYEGDPAMTRALHAMLKDDQISVCMPLKDRRIIAALNHTQSDYAFDGERFWDYVQGGILHSLKINRDVNFHHLVTHVVAGKKDFYYPGELYRELVLAAYGEGQA